MPRTAVVAECAASPRDALIEALQSQLARIERKLDDLATARMVKDWYTTEEVASILGVTAYTVREWCRLGRARAQKRASGPGGARPWLIAHEELERLRNEHILPAPAR